MATVNELQAELVRVQDLRATLSDDDLAAKHACDLEMDKLRHRLKAEQADALDEAKANWADRAGNKGSHEHDAETAAEVAASFIPMEAGGAGGGGV